jgi:hypothetical protein
MPFIFIVPVWLVIVLAAAPLLFIRRLRFLAVHIIVGSSMAILMSFTIAIAVLVAGGKPPRVAPQRFRDIWGVRAVAHRRRRARTGARHLSGAPDQHPPRMVARSGFVATGLHEHYLAALLIGDAPRAGASIRLRPAVTRPARAGSWR